MIPTKYFTHMWKMPLYALRFLLLLFFVSFRYVVVVAVAALVVVVVVVACHLRVFALCICRGFF